MNQNNPSNSQASMLSSINRVDGFDPTLLAVDYIDLNTQEKRKWLPVMAQMAWFRLKYPEGKIAISVEATKDCFVAAARIYISYKDPVDWYLAEATASRKFDPMKPTVSPREWAQTAAVGIALRNAGFGLQFGAAGADFETQAADELGAEDGIPLPSTPAFISSVPQTGSVAPVAPPPEKEPEVVELTPEQRFEQACAVNHYLRVFLIDIGGYTTDVLLLRNGKPDMQFCRSLEKGIIDMNNNIIRLIGVRHDMLIEEEHIHAVLSGKDTILPEAVKETIRESANQYAKGILDKLRELQVDLRSNPAVFIGGGSALFKSYLEASPLVAQATFVESPNSNAIGYQAMAEGQLSLQKT